MVVGTDLAELLMKNRSIANIRAQSVTSLNSMDGVHDINEERSDLNLSSPLSKDEYITNKFREYLIYGSEKEALGNLKIL